MTGTLAAIPALLALAGSPASVGTGIQAGPVCLPVTAQPGASYTLPPVTVQNTGSGGETIGLTVQNPGPGSLPGKSVPPEWVRFSAPVSLGSGATGTVTARLTLPPSARRGSYEGWVVAGPAGSGTPGQVSLGAEAIANFKFRVARPGHASHHVSCAVPVAAAHNPAAPAASLASWSPADPANRIPLIGACLAMFGVWLLARRRSS